MSWETAMRAFKPGDVIKGFELVERLAAGGMGSVWRARREGVGYPLALKLPFFDPGGDVSTIVGFEAEEMILRRLTGPHVPRFAGSGDLSGTPFIAMEFIQGVNLSSLLPNAPLPLEQLTQIGVKAAAAVASLHGQMVSHLDLKPGNILLTERGAVLIDFGLARHAGLPDLFAEESDVPMGTPAYISPEQVLGDRTNPASDIFALGCILYELATGEKPFGEPSGKAGMQRRLYYPPRPPRALNPALPRWMQEIILKCLEVDPARRYKSAGSLLADLNHPGQIRLTERAGRTDDSGLLSRLRKLLPRRKNIAASILARANPILSGPAVVLAAVDLSESMDPLAGEVRLEAARALRSRPDSRLACLTILKTKLAGEDKMADSGGRSLYIGRLVSLKHWAEPLALREEAISFHVIEAFDIPAAILNYAANNDVGHIIVGARASSAIRRHLGSVSARIVAEAQCSVSVVRVRRLEEAARERPPE
jgi:eukaryotic-like serine/threonine-protein kinase